QVLDQVLPFDGGRQQTAVEANIGHQNESQQRADQANDKQQYRHSDQWSHEQAESDGHFPPAEDRHHHVRVAPIDGVRQQRSGGLVAELFEQAEPDKQQRQREA